MTEYEAQRRLERIFMADPNGASEFLGGLVALGLIKFDPPKDDAEELRDELIRRGHYVASVCDDLISHIREAGYRIVKPE